MPFFRYARNVGRSVKYALPTIVKNRVSSVANLVSQFTDEGQRESSVNAMRDISGILKEDVFGLMRDGLKNATRELKTGKFYQTEEDSSSSMGEAFGFDESLMSNDFLSGGDAGDGGSTGGSTASTAEAAALGAASGVEAVTSRLGDSPAARASAEAGIASARFSRAQLGASVAVGNMIRGAVMANAQILGEMHRFQTDVQQEFYRQSLEHNTAMRGLTSELVERIAELRQVSMVAAAASDQVMQGITGERTNFDRVFGSGGTNVGEYLSIVAGRLRSKVDDFGGMARMMLAAPLTHGFEMAVESLIPDTLTKQLEQFNRFAGDLGVVLNERARNWSRRLSGSGSMLGGAASKVLNFLSVEPGRATSGPDLSNIVRGKAVAFDGYAHRSIVEVIPSHLADIHAELVAMRTGFGHDAPADRKLYDFKTGRFTSEIQTRRKYERDAERSSLAQFDRVGRSVGDDGDRATAADLREVFKALRDENLSINAGDAGALGSQLDDIAARLRDSGRTDRADALGRTRDRFVAARESQGARFAYELQAAIERANSEMTRLYEGVATEEGVHRMMYSGSMVDPETGKSLASGGVGTKAATASVAAPGDDTTMYGAATEFKRGYAGQASSFRDDKGNVTARSVLRSPIVLFSKLVDGFETRVSDMFFGDGTKGGARGIFGSIRDALLGDVDPATGRRTGVAGRLIDAVKLDVFTPLKKSLVGDPKDPKSAQESLLGRTKDWFGGVTEQAKTFLFGRQEEGEDGALARRGGLFGGVVGYLSGKNRQLREYLLGSGKDGEREGVLTGLRERFDRVATRVGQYFFGEQYTLTDDYGNTLTRRRGGVFGDAIQKGKDFLGGLWVRFQDRVVNPLATSLLGTVGADGRRAGGLLGSSLQKGKDYMSRLWDETRGFVLEPVKRALFGKGVSVDDGFGNVTFKDRGLFPVLGDTLKSSIIEPMAKSLFGAKAFRGLDKDGKPIFRREGGAVGQVWSAVKDAFAPLKETFVGKDGLWPQLKKGLSDTWTDLKRSLFGGKRGELQKPFMERMGEKLSAGVKRVGDWLQEALKPLTDWVQRGGDWLRTKVFEPFNSWLNDPKTGFITRMREGTASFFYGKKNEETGLREGGLFGSIKKGMDRFFYGDPEKGTKGFVESVVEPAKKFVLDEIWKPLKNSVNEMWEGTKTFFKKEVFEPLKGVLQPFVVEAKEQWRLMKEWVKGPLWESVKGVGAQINLAVKDAFGVSLTDMLKKNVLDPIKDVLGSVRKFLGTALGALFKIPVNVMKNVSDELKFSQIRRGIGGYLTPEERSRLLVKFDKTEADVPAGSGSSLSKTAVKSSSSAPAGEKAAVEKKSFLERMRAAMGRSKAESTEGRQGPAAQSKTPSTPVRSDSATEAGVRTGAAKTASVAAPGPGASTASSTQTASSGLRETSGNGLADKSPSAVSQPSPASGSSDVRLRSTSPEQANAAAVATADNTRNLYTFVSTHLRNVGKNLERVVKHFKIKEGIIGENAEARGGRGVFGRLKNFVTNPVGALSDAVSWVFDGMRKSIQRATSWITNLLTLPFKALSASIKALNAFVGGIREHLGNILGVIKDAVVSTVGAMARMTGVLIRETASAVSGVVVSIAKAVPAVASALTSAATSILKAGAELTLGVAKILGSLAITLVKVGGTMIATAAEVTKNVVTTLAHVTFDAIGSAFRAMRGDRAARFGKLTPVFVVGGHLAGTEGGLSSWTGAQAGFAGGRSLRMAAGAGVGALTGVGALVGAAAGFFSPEVTERIADGKVTVSAAIKRGKERMAAPFKRLSGSLKAAGAGVADVASTAVDVVLGKKNKAGARKGGVAADVSRQATEAAVNTVRTASDAGQGTWQTVRERGAAAKKALAETEWRDKLLGASSATEQHLGQIRTGFGKVGSALLMGVTAISSSIGSLATWFMKGRFLTALASAVGGGGLRAAGGAAADAVLGKRKTIVDDHGNEQKVGPRRGGLFDRHKTIVDDHGNEQKVGPRRGGLFDRHGSGEDGASRAGKPPSRLKGRVGVGLGLGGAIAGGLISSAADGMEDGTTKRTVQTGASMLQYGSVGAMFGPVGMAAGAALGAVVANFDVIIDAAQWLGGKLKLVGGSLWDAAAWTGNALKAGASAVWSHFFGNDFELDKNGKVVRMERRNVLGRFWETLFGGDRKVLEDGQVVKEGGLGLVGNVKNVLLNGVSVFGKMLSGQDWEFADLAKDTVLQGVWDNITNIFKGFEQKITDIARAIGEGLKYVTEFRFVDDIKGAISNWWNGSDKAKTPTSGSPAGTEFMGPADTRAWYQRLGASMTGWAEDSKSKVDTVTVNKAGETIVNRAQGGPLGRAGTMVGELGPELLDANGNVISGGRAGHGVFSDPAAVAAAQEREGSITSLLKNLQDNSFYTASLLASVNAAVGGTAVRPLGSGRESVFQPKTQSTQAKDTGLFSLFEQAVGGSVGDAAGEFFSTLKSGASAVGATVTGGVKNVADTAVAAAKETGAALLKGDVRGAGTALAQGAAATGSTIKEGVQATGQALGQAGTALAQTKVGSAVRLGAGQGQAVLLKAAAEAGITSPTEQAMFLAQLDHESGGFRKLSESFAYRPERLTAVFPKYFRSIGEAQAVAQQGPEAIAERVYGGRMGNSQPGDGFKFRGRGFIQLTGRNNYAAASKALGVDLLSNPDLAADPDVAARAAVWFWKSRGVSGPASRGDVRGATKLINNGTNGLADRQDKFRSYLAKLQQGSGGASEPGAIKTAMTGGRLDARLPTLVGEREPEVLGPDGRIHRSVDAYLGAAGSDPASLAVNTAVKEAARRAAAGPDQAGAGDAIAKVFSAAQAAGGRSDEILGSILEVLREIAGNTGKALEAGPPAPSVPAQTNAANVQINRHGGNLFSLGGSGGGPTMSREMRQLVAGA